MKYLEVVISLCVLAVGVYMYSAFGTNGVPSISGIGFTLVGIALLINNYNHHMK